MRWPMVLVAVMVMVVCGPSTAMGPEVVELVVEQQRPCSCSELAEKGLIGEEFAGCKPVQIRGTVLVVGGASIRQAQVHRDGQWLPLDPPTFGEHQRGDVLVYDTVLRVVYPGDLKPLEILEQEQDGSTVWRYSIHNVRRGKSIRIYVGDTAEFVRLDCVLSGGKVRCGTYREA